MLGPQFWARALPLSDPYREQATLIHHGPEHRDSASFAVLYVHGWTDYFFNPRLGEFFTQAGAEFYALDFHASGRSLRPGQEPGYTDDLANYFPDLEAASSFIRRAHPSLPLVLLAHSQGGLTALTWLKQRGHTHIDGLILNAPWVEQYWPWFRRILTPIARLWARVAPRARIPVGSPRFYERCFSAEFGGLWHINEDWRPDHRAPARPGWAHAILQAQRELQRGKPVTLPVLSLTSDAFMFRPWWQENMRHHDVITQVHQTRRALPRICSDLEMVQIRGAIHDVFLSSPAAKSQAYRRVIDWLERNGFR